MIRADPSKDASSGLEFENYRHICFKWHFRLTKVCCYGFEKVEMEDRGTDGHSRQMDGGMDR